MLSGIGHALRAEGAGPNAVSGKVSSARCQVPTARRIGCSSTAVAPRFTAAQTAEKEDLGPWYRPDQSGRRTKIHAVCDAKGRPHVLVLTPRNVHDCKVARTCIAALPPSAELVADKGYDSQALREWLGERGTRRSSRRGATARSSTTTTPRNHGGSHDHCQSYSRPSAMTNRRAASSKASSAENSLRQPPLATHYFICGVASYGNMHRPRPPTPFRAPKDVSYRDRTAGRAGVPQHGLGRMLTFHAA